MRNFIFGILVTVAAAVLVVLIVVYMGLFPTEANVPPPHWERRIAMTAMDASMDRHAPRETDPLPPTDENLIDGMKLYTMNCAECHGTLDLKPASLQHGLYPPPPQLILHPLDDPEWHTYYAIRTGIRYTGMPAWEKVMSKDDIWKITAFLSHLDKLPAGVQQEWKKSFGVEPPSPKAEGGRADHD